MNPFFEKKYKVLVHCCTYNQSKYIEQTLDGFVLQNTDFPFLCLIVDDCSTDGEQNVIEHWMYEECDMENAKYFEIPESKIIVVSHKRNVQCVFAFYFLTKNLYREQEKKRRLYEPWQENCEYFALCEGDDYWIGAEKLQKQVVFLENNSDYSMCFHSAFIEKENETLKTNIACETIEDRDYSSNEIFSRWIIPTASVVLRKEILSAPLKRKENLINGDIIFFLTCCEYGKIHGFSEKMAVYRLNMDSVTQNLGSKLNRIKKYPDFFEAIAENFPSLSREILDYKKIVALCERAVIPPISKQSFKDIVAAFRISCFRTCLMIPRCVLKKLKYFVKSLFSDK